MLFKVGPKALLYPTAVWLLILFVLFAAEYLVMLALPVLLPNEPTPLLAALIDSVTITAVVAPIIWWTLVRPMRQVIRLRTQFLNDLFTAIEAERRQTAHELHDGIGQELSLLISSMRTTQDAIADPNEAARYGSLQALAQKALAEVRRISRGLRPSVLDDLGLVAAVEKLVGDFRDHAGVELTLVTNGLESVVMPDQVATAVFRILQEALANIVRHADARHASIELRRELGDLVLIVADDGRGFDPKSLFERTAAGNHLGLIGMRERTALLDGRFSLETAPGRGCRVSIALPTGGAKS